MLKKAPDHQEIWNLLNELIEAGKETDRRMKETDKMMRETDRRMKETDRRMKETDKSHNKISKDIEKLKDLVGGIGNSNGYVAEELFYNSFSKKMAIGKMTFDYIDRNMERTHRGLTDEFDIVLTNSSVLVIVEVKYNFHPNDVDRVLKKIENFRKLFPLYKEYKIFGAIAGLTLSQKTIDVAKQYGFFVLTQEGNTLKVLNDTLVEYT
ncbi:MAG: hypothetical protein HQK75_15485 [Candidatus Magnetomorum sp.]|nr:hypothetical protein [Candidatus Magnetomorum sp.]